MFPSRSEAFHVGEASKRYEHWPDNLRSKRGRTVVKMVVFDVVGRALALNSVITRDLDRDNIR